MASRGRVWLRFTDRLAVAAVVYITARIDAAATALNERCLALELTLAGLTRRRRVRWGHAYLATPTAVGSVTRGIHAGRVAGGLFTTGCGARAVLTNFPRATRFAAAAAILRIGALVDTRAGARGVAWVAIERALSRAAHCHAIRGGRADLAAGATIAHVAVEFLATAVACAIACRAGQRALGALTDGGGMRRGAAHSGAIAAVARIIGQIHARAPAIGRAGRTGRGALTAGAHFILLTLRAAGAAVVRILIGLHASAAALRIAHVAGRAACSRNTSRAAIGGGVANIMASAAVRRAMLGIDAARVALFEAVRAREIATRLAAQRTAVIRTGASRQAVAAVVCGHGEVQARPSAIVQAGVTAVPTLASGTDQARGARPSAFSAVFGIAL